MIESKEYESSKNDRDVQALSKQINEEKRNIKFDTRDYVIDYLNQVFKEERFYIPSEYQRQFVWKNKEKCNFIESLLMGLPIPFMFFADTDDGRVEIVDGAQRIQTINEFLANGLELENLQILKYANGFRFGDLEKSVQNRFKNINIRVVFLDEGTTVETRQEIFKRINTGGMELTPTEGRRGALGGPFKDYIDRCASENTLFNLLAPRTEQTEKRYEGFELLLRFFAYLNTYSDDFAGYTGNVSAYLDEYLSRMNSEFRADETLQQKFDEEINRTLEFVQKCLGDRGFRKSSNSKATPRARFEAIAVGVALALRENELLPPDEFNWIDSDDFNKHTKSDAANNKGRLVGRIDYVKGKLLGE